jgi:hypothetical protein
MVLIGVVIFAAVVTVVVYLRRKWLRYRGRINDRYAEQIRAREHPVSLRIFNRT